jgi:ribosomal protein S27AE
MTLNLDNICPHCGYSTDAVDSVKGTLNIPKDNDWSFCIKCGNWSVFAPRGLRFPTDAETIEILNNPECAQMEQAWVETIGKRSHD